jgi:hypothetical protein
MDRYPLTKELAEGDRELYISRGGAFIKVSGLRWKQYTQRFVGTLATERMSVVELRLGDDVYVTSAQRYTPTAVVKKPRRNIEAFRSEGFRLVSPD